MDAKDYFLHPSEPRQRHYEALRTVHAEGLSIRVAAERFGLSAAYLKKLSAEFKTALKRGEPYFFAPPPKGRKPGRTASPDLLAQIVAMRKRNFSVPDIRAAAERTLSTPSKNYPKDNSSPFEFKATANTKTSASTTASFPCVITTIQSGNSS